MLIGSEVEVTTRGLLGHAIRGEFKEYADVLEAIGEQGRLDAERLCMQTSGYIAIDICAYEWPAQADLLRIAGIMARADTKFDLDQADVYDYLSRAVLGFQPLLDVFPDREKLRTVPFYATAALLVAYRPEGKQWWEYLDVIEKALQVAAPLAPDTVPAVLLLARRAQALKEC